MKKKMDHVMAFRLGNGGMAYLNGLCEEFGMTISDVMRAILYETSLNDRALHRRLEQIAQQKDGAAG